LNSRTSPRASIVCLSLIRLRLSPRRRSGTSREGLPCGDTAARKPGCGPTPRRSVTIEGVKEIWSARVGQAAAKYGEHAPTAAVCCNACRACMTTNAVAIASGAALAVVGFARRLVRRA
jgi:hypothetical protein